MSLRRKIFFQAVIFTAVCFGIVFLMYPTLEEFRESEIQKDLTEKIEHVSDNEGAFVQEIKQGEGIGVLEIPKIQAELPVVKGISKDLLKVSECWVTQTADIGSEGNAVIAGHRSYTYGRHFNRIDELEIGDEIHYTQAGGSEVLFVVNEILIKEPDDPEVFTKPEKGVSQLTLYTCTPVRIASQRLIVRALRIK